jgi:hypothetical protein
MLRPVHDLKAAIIRGPEGKVGDHVLAGLELLISGWYAAAAYKVPTVKARVR